MQLQRIMAGCIVKRGGWAISVYQSTEDRVPTVKVRRVKRTSLGHSRE